MRDSPIVNRDMKSLTNRGVVNCFMSQPLLEARIEGTLLKDPQELVAALVIQENLKNKL